MRINGVTLQVDVSDMSASRRFYDSLFDAEPGIVLDDDLQEYEVHPGFWLQLTTAEGEPAPLSRLRFGSDDIEAAHAELGTKGIEATAIDSVPGVVSWCDFEDPDGHPLGLYQDLS